MTFALISGHVALDFAGTMGRWRTGPVDLLVTPDDLARWLTGARVVDDPPAVDDEDLARARLLRAAVYRLAWATAHGRAHDADDRRSLNAAAAVAPVRLRLAGDGTARRTGDVDAALSTVARAAVDLLTGPDSESVRECGDGECTRLFVDHSARGSRRWCDMRTCGNRAKAQSFRRRSTVGDHVRPAGRDAGDRAP